MAVNFPSGFTMSHNEPVDNRLVLSKKEMLEIRATKMPSVYLAVCSDDGKLYIYNSANSKSPTTGKFRVIEADINTETLTEEITGEVMENLEVIPSDKIQTLFQEEEINNGN